MIGDRVRLMDRDRWFAEMYGDPEACMATAEELISEMDRCGVDRAVASGFAWNSPDLCLEANSYVADAVSRFPDRLVAFAVVPPLHPGASGELDRCLEMGFKGIGELLPDGQGFDIADTGGLTAVADWAVAHGWPVLVHASEPLGRRYPGKGRVTPDKCYRLAVEFPDLKLVLAHWGGGLPFYEMMPDVRKALANVYYDCAASPFLYDAGIFQAALKLLGRGKIVFGTDFPLITPGRYLREIKELGLDPEDYDAIMGGNARALLGEL